MAGLGHRIGDTLRLPGPRLRRVFIVVVVLAVAAAIGGAVALSVPSVARALGLGSAKTAAAAPPDQFRPLLGPLSSDAPMPTDKALAATLDPLAGASALGRFTGIVIDPASGKTLWSRDPARPLTPASTGKVLTTSAALLALNTTGRLVTRVVAGPTPDSVVLVGGGDPTLSVLPVGKESVYPGAPKIDTLAAAVAKAAPGPIKKVIVDVSRYAGNGLAPGWQPADVAGGFVTPIVPLMVDGGRSDPTAQDGARVAAPAQAAGRALAQRLGADPNAVTVGNAPQDAKVLGEVYSAPITDLVEQTLRNSDNVLAEMLAREVAIARGAEPSFAGAAKAVQDTLSHAGFDVTGVQMVDGSGLSTQDVVPAQLLAQLMSAAAAPNNGQQTDYLRTVLTGLSVAGGDGTLVDRYATGAVEQGRGYVRGKTGTLTGVTSLAGVVTDVDGRLLVFALMSNGAQPALARPRLDGMASALRLCGCR